MRVLKKKVIISDLRKLFQVDENNKSRSYEGSGSFGVNKTFLGRYTVIAMLQNYFKDKVFEKGLGLEVSPITLLFTTFKVIDVDAQKIEQMQKSDPKNNKS